MAELPQEIIVEILLWLPVKSLLRFKCVSNSLFALIDSPNFINSHLIRSSQNFNLRKLIFRVKYFNNGCDVNADLERKILRLSSVCAYCNGMFLLFRNDPLRCTFTLWNPSTRRYRDLPHSEPSFDIDQPYRMLGFGLGYDDSIDDYKAFYIVRVLQRKLEPKLQIQVWIYGLKSNIWRRAQDFPYLDYNMDPEFVDFGIGSYFADGSVHWLCTFNKNVVWKREIASFDMRKETFSLVPQPVCSISSVEHLYVLGGCLCIGYLSNPKIELYIRRKDGGDQFTWTQLYSVTKGSILPRDRGLFWGENVKVLAYSKRGDTILHYFSKAGLVWYDLKKKSFRKVEIDMEPNFCKDDMIRIAPIHCVESLVSVGRGSGAQRSRGMTLCSISLIEIR